MKKSTGEHGLYAQKIKFFLVSSLSMHETLEYIVLWEEGVEAVWWGQLFK